MRFHEAIFDGWDWCCPLCGYATDQLYSAIHHVVFNQPRQPVES